MSDSHTHAQAAHDPLVAHQFDDMEQQFEASTLGMWVFLITEIMFFGGLFAGYAVYRWKYPAAFDAGSLHLDVRFGAINTAVLICSSLTMAMAVRAAQFGKREALCVFLILTMLLGSVFLGIKAYEYNHKYHEHLIPGVNFQYEGSLGQQVQLFFIFYFVMTGMHALHMVIGAGIMSVLLVKAWRRRFSPDYFGPVDIGGLYWHFVDIVWIYLFPLLYLLGRG